MGFLLFVMPRISSAGITKIATMNAALALAICRYTSKNNLDINETYNDLKYKYTLFPGKPIRLSCFPSDTLLINRCDRALNYLSRAVINNSKNLHQIISVFTCVFPQGFMMFTHERSTFVYRFYFAFDYAYFGKSIYNCNTVIKWVLTSIKQMKQKAGKEFGKHFLKGAVDRLYMISFHFNPHLKGKLPCPEGRLRLNKYKQKELLVTYMKVIEYLHEDINPVQRNRISVLLEVLNDQALNSLYSSITV